MAAFEAVMGALSPPRRTLATFALALAVHAPVLAAVMPRSQEDPAVLVAKRQASARAERARILGTAERDIAAGRTTLGATLIALGGTDRDEDDPARLDHEEQERALATYRLLLADVRARHARGEPLASAIHAAVAADGRAARYKRMYPRLVDALANGGGNCVALSTLAVSLAYDAGQHEGVGMRVYTNHVVPEVDGFRFGMASRCHGEGVKVAARELLERYARARATRDREPFAFPASDDACDDPGDVFGGLQLRRDDPAPMPARGLAPPGGGPAAPAIVDADCRRRTVLEEYDDDVEAMAADGTSLGGVGLARSGSLDLEGHAKSASCFESRVDARAEDLDDESFVLALGDAALSLEEAARVFAAAGELDVAREYERRLAVRRAEAAAPLERVNARLMDPGARPSAVVTGAGRLVALGEGGRTTMLLASEQHRGFWELATLMTRPSSRVGALARWGKKAPDVQLDVVDALPCGSEAFLAQLADPPMKEAAAMRLACEARVHAERQPCELDAAVARFQAPRDGEEAADLAQAVVVRRLAARCREPAFVADARRWAAGKPESLGRAATARLAF